MAGDPPSGERVALAREFTTYGNATESTSTKVNKVVRTFERSQYVDPLDFLNSIFPAFESFKYRKIKAPVAFLWLAFQCVCIIYQEVFISEMDGHLELYKQTMEQNCGSEHMQRGVCIGPNWKLAVSDTLQFAAYTPDDDFFDFRRDKAELKIPFQTSSSPTTFLVVAEPMPPHTRAHYHFAITDSDTKLWRAMDWSIFGGRRLVEGKKVMVFENRHLVADMNRTWEARLSLDSRYQTPVDLHVYIVDCQIKHLADIHSQPMCSFEKSWMNFTVNNHHFRLTKTMFFTRLFQMIQIGCVALIFYRYFYQIEGSRLFVRILFLKFIFQDFPQQIAMVTYIYNWYSEDGLRCQMCLFHPDHCIDQYPLHTSNLIACVLCLLSAASSQMFLQVNYKTMDEDDAICFACGRLVLLSVSILPFSTAVFLLSSSLLHLGSGLLYVLFVLLTVYGWSAVCCVPMFALCEDI